jgi:hypothetical protein
MKPEQVILELATERRPIRAAARKAVLRGSSRTRRRLRARVADLALARSNCRWSHGIMERAVTLCDFSWRRIRLPVAQGVAPVQRLSAWFQIWLALRTNASSNTSSAANPGTVERVLGTRVLRSTSLETMRGFERRLHGAEHRLETTLDTRTEFCRQLFRKRARYEATPSDRVFKPTSAHSPVGSAPTDRLTLHRAFPTALARASRNETAPFVPSATSVVERNAWERLVPRAEPSVDIERLAERVIRALDQRLLAMRERMGRV